MKIIVPEFVLEHVRDVACDLVQSACDFVTVGPQGNFSGDISGAEVVVLPWQMPAPALQTLLALPTVRWIHAVSAGVDHALDDTLRGLDVVLTNARGVFDLPIAETVLAYILMITKHMPAFFVQQQQHVWRKHRLREAAGLTVGIVGLGSIGAEIARLCRGVGMHVTATRRHADRAAPYVDRLYPPDQLLRLLGGADFVVVALPLTLETQGLIGERELRAMRSDAWFINIARGAIVDEPALVKALQARWIGGAALDVFVEEPLPSNSPLWALDNVILTPHNSWSTPHVEVREATLFLENLERYLRGESLQNVVDKRLGY